ncbi:MAG: hypothetical protein KIT72_00295 [Polyangiaceae bacterium]|nr:hypothetical protein [Polyangiaceae bacterium]MCW5788835.1 hypothetical protein [Polyangiaceae bacterium]
MSQSPRPRREALPDALPTPKRQLPMQRTNDFARHPKDGWTYADPYPMSDRYRARLHAIIERLCPPPPAPMSGDLLTQIELHVRGFMMYMHPLAGRGLWLAFILLDWAPRLLFMSWRRLGDLDRQAADRVISRITSTRWMPLRLLVVGIRGSVLSAYFDLSEVHERLNYRPVPFLKERVALRERLVASPALLGATALAAE